MTVPPGQGKPSTKDRNRRRRIARKFKAGEATSSDAEGNKILSSLPETPASGSTKSSKSKPTTSPIDATPRVVNQQPLMMMSLKNSNKRKGYKDRLNGAQPTKLVFGSSQEVEPEASSLPIPALVPPSQRSSLPSNIVVTSIDVEADLWGQPKRRPGGGQKDNRPNGHQATGKGKKNGYLDPYQYYPNGTSNAGDDADVELDYGTADDVLPPTTKSTPGSVDWTTIRTNFANLSVVEYPATLNPGSIVCWEVCRFQNPSYYISLMVYHL